jgi:cation:H+ antiporter
MAIGWIVWSNIFNVLWILSATAFVKPLYWYKWMEFDLSIELIASMLVFLFAFSFRKYFLERIEWIVLVLAYIWFLLYQSYKVGMFS